MSEEKQPSIEAELRSIKEQAEKIFEKCEPAMTESIPERFTRLWDPPDRYWDQLPKELKAESQELQNKVVTLGKRAAIICRKSVLTTDADQSELVLSIKEMRAALWLRAFDYTDTNVLHDEGIVLGVEHAHQSENRPLNSNQAKGFFKNAFLNISRIFDLTDLDATGIEQFGRDVTGLQEARKYRRNTAFILMWMDNTKPELEDVKYEVTEVFSLFGIKAYRADDIEHQDSITQRIIDEITKSEFLFADLTGARPSVYYEVGYAHALGKRVILYREKGAKLHFDLADYNCPEYKNLVDLRKKLTRRLEFMTGKKLKKQNE